MGDSQSVISSRKYLHSTVICQALDGLDNPPGTLAQSVQRDVAINHTLYNATRLIRGWDHSEARPIFSVPAHPHGE